MTSHPSHMLAESRLAKFFRTRLALHFSKRLRSKTPSLDPLLPHLLSSSSSATAHLRGGQTWPPSPLPSGAGASARSGSGAAAGIPVRAGYLFGHDRGYGKKIEIDNYRIPIYANKSQGSRSISVQVELSLAQRSVFYDVRSEKADERREESYDYANPTDAYGRHYYKQSLFIQVSPNRHRVSEEEAYHDQMNASYTYVIYAIVYYTCLLV